MILKIFTVLDSVAGAYLQPFYMQSTGAAIRSFEDTVNIPENSFNKHPSDYTLFEIGTFDDQNCVIEQLQKSIPLGRATDYIHQKTFSEEEEQLDYTRPVEKK